MALGHFWLIIVQAFIYQIIPLYAQYFQYAGAPYPIPAIVTGYPVQSYAPSPAPIYAQQYSQSSPNYQPATNVQPYKTSAVPVGAPTYAQTSASYAPTHVPTHVPTPPKAVNPPIYQPTPYQTPAREQSIKTASVIPPALPDPPKLEVIKPAPFVPKETPLLTNPTLPKDLLSGASPPFDSNILNNLAIALQLLIVSNLIHNPPPSTNPVSQIIDEDIFPEIAPLPIAYMPPSLPEPQVLSNQYIPNANFLGTSSFGDTGISKSMMSAYGSPTLPAPRPSSLMSPYDAIGPNSPYKDSFHSKPESKSPYHLSSDYKDLFALTELFRI